MPGVFPVTCGDYRVHTTNAHGLRAHRAPGIPHALCRAEATSITRADRAAGRRSCVRWSGDTRPTSSCPGLTRASIPFAKSRFATMDCNIKPGN